MTRLLKALALAVIVATTPLYCCAAATADSDSDYAADNDNEDVFIKSNQLRLSTFVDSHMVLQREPLKARVWGWAAPAANVTVRLTKNSHHGNDDDDDDDDNTKQEFAIVDDDGSWLVDLPPQPAGDGYAIAISDDDDTNNIVIHLEDIVFGDVYLCSGQSNMELAVSQVFDAAEEIVDSIHYPNLRLATVEKDTADTPQTDASARGSYTWARSSPQAVNDTDTGWGVFSATCYFFGRDLYRSLDGKVPIGLVTSCWGGQRVETFSSSDALADTSCGGTRPASAAHQEEKSLSLPRLENKDRILQDHAWYSGREDYSFFQNYEAGAQPTQLWNAMIYPLLPMRFAGAVWYQGEANANDAVSYSCRFPAMISDWRAKFELPHLSFFYVQLASFLPGTTWPNVRAAQGAALQLPRVGFATAIDLSDPTSPAGNIHPRRKQEVGRRLSLSAQVIQYKEREGLVYTGPTLACVQLKNEPTHTMLLLGFSPGTADGLHLQGAAACSRCCDEPPFQVLDTKSGNWTRVAKAQVRNAEEAMLLTTADKIVGVRYAWEPRPECILYNGQGGPDDHTGLAAAPFEWCAYPSGKGAWTGQGCKLSNDGVVEDTWTTI